jgi:hypothetical protein
VRLISGLRAQLALAVAGAALLLAGVGGVATVFVAQLADHTRDVLEWVRPADDLNDSLRELAGRLDARAHELAAVRTEAELAQVVASAKSTMAEVSGLIEALAHYVEPNQQAALRAARLATERESVATIAARQQALKLAGVIKERIEAVLGEVNSLGQGGSALGPQLLAAISA